MDIPLTNVPPAGGAGTFWTPDAVATATACQTTAIPALLQHAAMFQVNATTSTKRWFAHSIKSFGR